jgi:hypothetical protein
MKNVVALNVIGFNPILVIMAILFFKHLCYTLGIVRQPNLSSAAELRAEYCCAVLEIRLVSAQKPSLTFIKMEDNHACFFCI